jgi:multidrug transporter EmrE-like cation transporter
VQRKDFFYFTMTTFPSNVSWQVRLGVVLVIAAGIVTTIFLSFALQITSMQIKTAYSVLSALPLLLSLVVLIRVVRRAKRTKHLHTLVEGIEDLNMLLMRGSRLAKTRACLEEATYRSKYFDGKEPYLNEAGIRALNTAWENLRNNERDLDRDQYEALEQPFTAAGMPNPWRDRTHETQRFTRITA